MVSERLCRCRHAVETSRRDRHMRGVPLGGGAVLTELLRHCSVCSHALSSSRTAVKLTVYEYVVRRENQNLFPPRRDACVWAWGARRRSGRKCAPWAAVRAHLSPPVRWGEGGGGGGARAFCAARRLLRGAPHREVGNRSLGRRLRCPDFLRRFARAAALRVLCVPVVEPLREPESRR